MSKVQPMGVGGLTVLAPAGGRRRQRHSKLAALAVVGLVAASAFVIERQHERSRMEIAAETGAGPFTYFPR